MRDCVVVGCGRSGTSLAAGLLGEAGYDCGPNPLPPDEGGPTGFFEDAEVNRLNELLLAPYDAALLHPEGYSRPLRHGERWLAVLPDDVEPAPPAPELSRAMRAALPSSPYACKDPRFGYTLASWRPLFGNPLFVCVFRHPAATAESISRDVRYGDLTVSIDVAIEVWKAMYRRVLERHRHEGDWIFVHYEQLLDGTGVERLGEALGARLDDALVDPGLQRARAGDSPPSGTAPIYAELCAAAGHAR